MSQRLPDDPDLRGALPALRRAVLAARRLAIQTGTPCYIMRHGKIINIAAKSRTGKPRPSSGKRKSQRF